MVQKHYEFGVFAKTVTAIAAIFLSLFVASVDVGIFWPMLSAWCFIALAIYLQKVDDQKKRIKELEEMLEKQQQEENPDQSQ